MGLPDTGTQVTLTITILIYIPGTQCDYELRDKSEDTQPQRMSEQEMHEAFGALYT